MKLFRRLVLVLAVTSLVITCACGGGFAGTYSNGSAMLEFRSGGQVVLTFMGDSKTCTYQKSGTKVALNCPEVGAMELTVHDDGSLTGPPGSWMGIFHKTDKS